MPDRPMRILQVSASDRMGGAEKIARAMFDGYRARGHESWMAVGQKTTTDPDIFAIENDRHRHPWARLWQGAAATLSPIAGKVRGVKRLQRLMREGIAQPMRTLRRDRGQEDFDFPAAAELLSLLPGRPDLIHLHNLHSPGGYFDLRQLPSLSAHIPTVITLHDAWLLSGHCAHSFECDRWKTGCGQCPDLSIYPAVRKDATAFNWQRKRDLFARSRLHLCTPSQWLMDKVSQSILQPAVVDARVIPNGIDLTIFKPGDQAAARRELDLPQEARILLFAANGIRSNAFKDFRTMREALERVAQNWTGAPLLFVALGEDLPEERIGRAVIRFVPFQKDEAAVARHYQAADLYLHAARADTFPTSVLEALACAKPVIASHVGGIPEQIAENETGHLVPVGDAAAMAAAITCLLDDPQRLREMGSRAARVAKEQFDAQGKIEALLDWYREILVTSETAARTRPSLPPSAASPPR